MTPRLAALRARGLDLVLGRDDQDRVVLRPTWGPDVGEVARIELRELVRGQRDELIEELRAEALVTLATGRGWEAREALADEQADFLDAVPVASAPAERFAVDVQGAEADGSRWLHVAAGKKEAVAGVIFRRDGVLVYRRDVTDAHVLTDDAGVACLPLDEPVWSALRTSGVEEVHYALGDWLGAMEVAMFTAADRVAVGQRRVLVLPKDGWTPIAPYEVPRVPEHRRQTVKIA